MYHRNALPAHRASQGTFCCQYVRLQLSTSMTEEVPLALRIEEDMVSVVIAVWYGRGQCTERHGDGRDRVLIGASGTYLARHGD